MHPQWGAVHPAEPLWVERRAGVTWRLWTVLAVGKCSLSSEYFHVDGTTCIIHPLPTSPHIGRWRSCLVVVTVTWLLVSLRL
jgi:hypothetical protein